MTRRLLLAAATAAVAACSPSPALVASPADLTPTGPLGWRQHDTSRPQPPRVEPAAPGGAPSDAVVLIGPDGRGIEQWTAESGDGPPRWRVEDGALVATPGGGGIRSRESFGDVQVHVEWMPAAEPEKSGQNRSNSGLFLVDGRYEVQILDSWQNPTYADGRAAAIYGQFPPLADATRPPDAWQAYDVFFRMPRFAADGTVAEPARMTVVHNGVLVQNNEALPGTTMWLETIPYAMHGPGRILLQDHGSPVRFRNLWVRRLAERPAPPAGYAALAPVTLTAAERDGFVGRYRREEGDEIVIERLGDGLGLSMPWRTGVLRLIPLSPTTLQMQNTAGRIDATVGADGRVSGFTFEMGGATYRATRQ